MNVTQSSVTFSKDNIITLAQTKSNSLLRVQRMLHSCFKFFIKTRFQFSGGGCSDGLNKEEEQRPSAITDPKWVWVLYQRKWYVARIANNEEIPTSLKNKMSKSKEPSTVVQFVVDDEYSIFPMRKIEPFGNVEIDKKCDKLDPRGYSIVMSLIPAFSKSNVSTLPNEK